VLLRTKHTSPRRCVVSRSRWREGTRLEYRPPIVFEQCLRKNGAGKKSIAQGAGVFGAQYEKTKIDYKREEDHADIDDDQLDLRGVSIGRMF
jgi:hypothetical protein